MTIDVNEWMKEVKGAIEKLNVETEEEATRRREGLRKERDRKRKEKQKELKRELIQKINEFPEIDGKFGDLVDSIIQNDLSDSKLIGFLQVIDVYIGRWYSLESSYKELPYEDREKLFLRLKEKILKAQTKPAHDFMPFFTLPITSLEPEQEQEMLYHIKQVVLAYYKGFILKNSTKYYTYEALPSVLWFIEKSEVSTKTFPYRLFQYPDLLTEEETKVHFVDELIKWYRKRGRADEKLLVFEQVLEHKLREKDLKNARRTFVGYGYLFEEEYRDEMQQKLLSALYEIYEEIQQVEDPMKRKERLNDEILHELEKYQYVKRYEE